MRKKVAIEVEHDYVPFWVRPIGFFIAVGGLKVFCFEAGWGANGIVLFTFRALAVFFSIWLMYSVTYFKKHVLTQDEITKHETRLLIFHSEKTIQSREVIKVVVRAVQQAKGGPIYKVFFLIRYGGEEEINASSNKESMLELQNKLCDYLGLPQGHDE